MLGKMFSQLIYVLLHSPGAIPVLEGILIQEPINERDIALKAGFFVYRFWFHTAYSATQRNDIDYI
jgi:hypothetical protein